MKGVNKVKAVGLLSGGLDSAIAAKLILDQGIEVHAVNISMPWGCGRPSRVVRLAEKLGLCLKTIPLGDDYMPLLTAPKYGFGSAHNPCIDCHIYMVKKAAEYMREIGAAFVFTGEVLGQRPMSQHRKSLNCVEHDAGVTGRLVRPLSAKLMPVTIPEQEGVLDREKLLDLSGRSRSPQLKLAKEFGIEDFSTPGGGCLLTEKLFGERLKDVLKGGCPDIASTAILGVGRYFRLDDSSYVIVARNNSENEKLMKYAMPADIIVRPTTFPGPVALLRSGAVTEEKIAFTAGLAQFYSKSRAQGSMPLTCWMAGEPSKIRNVLAGVVNEADIRKMIL
ncbi:MAG: hypothetical protein HQL17_01550 [Candidatus Omnitrophica bacterium]|nr:hypothetical protein [Candidatus Omnitrophota bacterium]